jgi:hypothetical protein
MSNWKTKSLCELTLEDVLQGHAEGYCFPVDEGRFIKFFTDEKESGDDR